MKTIQPIEMPSVHEEIQNRIKGYIIANSLQPDDILPSETQLAGQLGVSRAVVREALRSLEALGVIHSRRGAGHFVSQFNLEPILQNMSYGMLFDVEDLQEIIAVRERLEVGFIPDAMAVMSDKTRQQLRDVIEQMKQKVMAGEDFLEEDLTFHRCIYLVTGNRLLLKLLDVFRYVYQNLHDQSITEAGALEIEVQNHEEILQAIEACNVELAQERLRQHFSGIKERLETARLTQIE